MISIQNLGGQFQDSRIVPKIVLPGGEMKITEVRVTLRNERKLRAFANITFNNSFVVRGLKVIRGSEGYFISMPSRKRADGSHQDIAHPINADMRKYIEQSVLDEYCRISGEVLEEAVTAGQDQQL